MRKMALRDEIQTILNRTNAENGSDTPDFILAEYLTDCLEAFDKATVARRKWFGDATLGQKLGLAETTEQPPPEDSDVETVIVDERGKLIGS